MEKQTLAKKIEIASNVAIIVLAIVLVGVFVRNYWLKPQPAELESAKVGQQLNLANWPASGNTLVFGLSTTCHFCSESAGFYKELVQKCAEQHVRTVAVLPQSLAEAKAYLQGEGVDVNEVRQMTLSDIKVAGTPTLILVDANRVVKAVWIGKLSPDQEKGVYAKLGS